MLHVVSRLVNDYEENYFGNFRIFEVIHTKFKDLAAAKGCAVQNCTSCNSQESAENASGQYRKLNLQHFVWAQ